MGLVKWINIEPDGFSDVWECQVRRTKWLAYWISYSVNLLLFTNILIANYIQVPRVPANLYSHHSNSSFLPSMYFVFQYSICVISMAYCKTRLQYLQFFKQWKYCSIPLSHRFHPNPNNAFLWEMNLLITIDKIVISVTVITVYIWLWYT